MFLLVHHLMHARYLSRIPESPGQDPCPQLEEHAGIWMFDPNRENQTIDDGKRFATGIRSTVAITWNPVDKNIYIVQHGRDDLHRTWPGEYTQPAKRIITVRRILKNQRRSFNVGWPYYYLRPDAGQKKY